MKTKIVGVILVAWTLGIGCSADQAGGGEVASHDEALRIGGGLGLQQCPGGKAPSCVACGGSDGITCVAACSGSFTCDIDEWDDNGSPIKSCGELGGSCATLGFGIFSRAAATNTLTKSATLSLH